MTSIEFVVRGIPVPQGALARNPKGLGLHAANGKTLRPWRDAIAAAARDVIAGADPLDGPISVDVCFVIARPAAHYLPITKSRPVRELRLDAPAWVAIPPDVDKLARSCLDALTGVAYRDDGQVASLRARTRYEGEILRPGCVVRVSSLAGTL